MNYSERALLVTAVGDEHTIVLPASILSGSTVGIVVLSEPPALESSSKARFKAALAEIEAAVAHSERVPLPMLPGAQFDALIERARKDSSPLG